jgi:hypothetical protein
METSHEIAPLDPKADSLPIDFSVENFSSAFKLMQRAFGLFFFKILYFMLFALIFTIPSIMITSILEKTLLVGQSELVTQLFQNGAASVIKAFEIPFIAFFLISVMRSERPAPLADCLVWGARHWFRVLIVLLSVIILMMLGLLCLIVPGIIVAIYLTMSAEVASIESKEEGNPLLTCYHYVSGNLSIVLPIIALSVLAELFLASVFVMLTLIFSPLVPLFSIGLFAKNAIFTYLVHMTNALLIIAWILTYLTLRRRKEEIEQMPLVEIDPNQKPTEMR